MAHVALLLILSLVTTRLSAVQRVNDVEVIFDRAVDASYRLRVTRTLDAEREGIGNATIRILLIDRINSRQPWELAVLRARQDREFAVERATARVLVFSWADEPYGLGGNIKLFLDLKAKRVEKRIDYADPSELQFADNRRARETLGVSATELELLRRRGAFVTTAAALEIPALLVTHPLPQSSKKSVLALRSDFRESGVTEKDIDIAEEIGAYQIDGDRVWFGKSFYDAEGTTGIGAIGSVGQNGNYTFLRVREVAPWSVRAILVENAALFAGLVHRGEGREYSGGLLRYDRNNQHSVVHPVPDVIHSITQLNGRLFLGTARGLYVRHENTLTRYRMEPDINGNLVVISQRL